MLVIINLNYTKYGSFGTCDTHFTASLLGNSPAAIWRSVSADAPTALFTCIHAIIDPSIGDHKPTKYVYYWK